MFTQAQQVGPTPLESKRRFNENSGQTSKVTESGASFTTLAAFQSGQRNRWLAAEMCG
jgi:hypothetical protein